VWEAEWKETEVHNNVEAAHWKIDAPDGWGNTPPTSPVPEGWPNLSVSGASGIQVTIEVKSSVGELKEHSTCRSLVLIGCLSVFDLLSFPCHSAIGTSIGSCAPHGSHGGVDRI
jgi:hypothetical protein